MWQRIPFLILPVALVIAASVTGGLTPRLRQPVSLHLLEGGKRLLVANRASGTISLLDAERHKVLGEFVAGGKLADSAVGPLGDMIVAADEGAGEIVVLGYRNGAVQLRRRLPVGMTPVSVRLTPDGKMATVALLWPRRIAILDLNSTVKPSLIDLPFAPRLQLIVGDKLIAADAFGGQLAVIDIAKKKVDAVRELPVHNIRGLALDAAGKQLLLTHQTLNRHGRTTSGDIQTSNLITNNLRKLPLQNVLEPLGDVLRNERLYSLGDIELGAGDPAAVVPLVNGQVVVAQAGVDEVAIGRPEEVLWTRLPTSRGPTALAVDEAAKRAFVANTFADSISVVDLETRKITAEIPLGPRPILNASQRGELLFHDARLSFEAWFSCASCHPQGHTNGRLNDNLSDGSFGTPKRVLSLLGAKDTGPWAWNGGVKDLAGQVRSSLRSTMQGKPPSDETVADLTAFLETLPPPPSLHQARGTLKLDSFARGEALFARMKCVNCHKPARAFTSPSTYDVGLRDEVGGTHFNPPSLRGISQAGPYFHDNRALSLDEVFTRFNHRMPEKLTAREQADLLHFLEGL